MPKMKTHRGAAKRFKKTGTGLFMKNKSHRSHILEKKSANRKRKLRKAYRVSEAEQKRLSKLMPYK